MKLKAKGSDLVEAPGAVVETDTVVNRRNNFLVIRVRNSTSTARASSV